MQVVDDGLATGLSAEAACAALRAAGARRIVLAVPVGSPATVRRLAAGGVANEIVCLSQPPAFHAVGEVRLVASPCAARACACMPAGVPRRGAWQMKLCACRSCPPSTP